MLHIKLVHIDVERLLLELFVLWKKGNISIITRVGVILSGGGDSHQRSKKCNQDQLHRIWEVASFSDSSLEYKFNQLMQPLL